MDQPVNSPESVYVKITDGANHCKTLIHPNPAATQIASWTPPWNIPLSELAGVNLADIKGVTLGIGSATNPRAGGSGVIYIDDILLENSTSP